MEKFVISVELDFPAIILIALLLLGLYVLWRTQKSNATFDFADMLRDENGKPSSARMAVFVCLAISSWALMYVLIKKAGDIDPWIFFSYVGIWSGAKVAENFIGAYAAKRTP
jgi:drug/metabolite transporter (DMT)-like permease